MFWFCPVTLLLFLSMLSSSVRARSVAMCYCFSFVFWFIPMSSFQVCCGFWYVFIILFLNCLSDNVRSYVCSGNFMSNEFYIFSVGFFVYSKRLCRSVSWSFWNNFCAGWSNLGGFDGLCFGLRLH
ncbi:hypothetical protein KFK09_002274 [Dendrobium nobile]|uniref:Uncharacterized protein n=1 Tax=Dendrobium nobile TaxID=94219 RepID=A0A8T3C9V0_DENNO|nr:hypothetical protein KFK09_002274 [Dendrobium nobile]